MFPALHIHTPRTSTLFLTPFIVRVGAPRDRVAATDPTDPTRARLRTIDCATRSSSPPPLRSGDEAEDEDDVAFVRWTRSR